MDLLRIRVVHDDGDEAEYLVRSIEISVTDETPASIAPADHGYGLMIRRVASDHQVEGRS